MATIFEMGAEYVELYELLEDEDITDEEFQERLAALDCDTDEKIEAYLRISNEYITKGEAKIAYAKAAEERIKQKKKSGEADINRAKNMREMVKNVLKVRNQKKFEGKLFRATVKAVAPTVEYDDINDIPKEYLIPQDPKINTKALKEMLIKMEEEGKTCEYARLKRSDTLLVK